MHRNAQRVIAAHLLRPILDSRIPNDATNSLCLDFNRIAVPAIQQA
jgi:hypothetical protein